MRTSTPATVITTATLTEVGDGGKADICVQSGPRFTCAGAVAFAVPCVCR